MGAVLDVHATQTTLHPERGIARSVLDLALALEAGHAGEMVGYGHLPDLPLPGPLEALRGSGRLVAFDALHRGRATVFHVGSPFEGSSLREFMPAAARSPRTALVVTLHDLIPLHFPDAYLREPWARRRYTTRLELVRAADLVLAISEDTARDAVEQLGIRPDRVVVTGLAPSGRFTPARPGDDAFARLSPVLPSLPRDFLLYPGGSDARKNVAGLLAAYARVDPEQRRRHPLVVTCRLDDDASRGLRDLAHELGLDDDVHATGLVTDDVLVDLYRAAHLVVFPSLHEGYGLPVMEARRCGAPVLAARTSALVELLPDEALFDPLDPADMAAAVQGVLDAPERRAALTTMPEPPGHTWPEVAERTVAAYRMAAGRRARQRARSPVRIGVVTPLPPEPTGVADHSVRLVEALSRDAAVELFTTDPVAARGPEGIGRHRMEHLERVQAGRGPFDGIVHAWGNSRFHAEMLPVMRAWPGLVIAHDVGVAGLYEWCGQEHPELVGGSFAEAIARLHPTDLPPDLDVATASHLDLDRRGMTMAREVIGWSERFLVHSEAAAELARADVPAHLHPRIGVLPFAVRAGRRRARPERVGRPPIVASFGVAQASKQVELLVDAFALVHAADPRVRLVFVGDVVFGVRRLVHQRADAAGVGHAVLLTGRVPQEQYEDWLAVADVAVQLRSGWNGESSAALGDALAWGIPTITSAVGAAAELPDEVVAKVPGRVDPGALADAVVRLLTDPRRRRALSEGGVAHAAAHTFEGTAAVLLELISRGVGAAPGRCDPVPGTPPSPS